MNRMIRVLLIIISLVIYSCKSNKITIKYDKENRYEELDKSMVADKSKEYVIVFLEDYFNGEVKGYVGDELVFNEKIETEESIGTTLRTFIYDYSKNKKLPIIKIETEGKSVDIDIFRNYKLIYIYMEDDKWEIIYSNVYATYE